MNGGFQIAQVLKNQGIQWLFTLSGGHIAPIFVEAKKAGIRVVDTRHEVNAVFAADAVARLTGKPGVAAVTAGPGLTNTITAVKNAQLAQSPVLILGGAAATILKGRGSLQDIDQMSLMRPHVKYAVSVTRVNDFIPLVEKALHICQDGVPGPVFVECPVDLLYDEEIVRDWYPKSTKKNPSLTERLTDCYIGYHLNRMFRSGKQFTPNSAFSASITNSVSSGKLRKVKQAIAASSRPVMVIGSQATLQADQVGKWKAIIEKLGIPVYLSGMARGLLGPSHPLQMRHKRKEALRNADLVILAGVPSDFRLDYGRQIPGKSVLIGINRSQRDLQLNRSPDIGILHDPFAFFSALEKENIMVTLDKNWIETLRQRDEQREAEITEQAQTTAVDGINPLALFRTLDPLLTNDAVLVADGGDFVATSAYTLRPRKPLTWLDPGAFGTLGVGGGFALGAKLANPQAEVWLIWGDGSSAYSLAEIDTFTRHGLPVIALIGNDAAWMQIQRDQVTFLHDDCASTLAYSDYHHVSEGYGGNGVKVTSLEEFEQAVKLARAAVAEGKSFVINAILAKSDFRKGSLSM